MAEAIDTSGDKADSQAHENRLDAIDTAFYHSQIDRDLTPTSRHDDEARFFDRRKRSSLDRDDRRNGLSRRCAGTGSVCRR